MPLPAPLRSTFAIDRAREDLGFTNRPLVDGMREILALERAGAL